MKDIVMPKLSDTMTEGTLISWKKKVGDKVNRGDVIAEVETDKANMELEAYTSGVLLQIKVEAGETAAVGTVVGVIGAPGEAAGPAQGEEKAKAVPARQEAPAEAAGAEEPAEVAKAPAAEKEAAPEVAPGVEPAEEEPGEVPATAAAGAPEEEAPAPTPAEAKGGAEPAGGAAPPAPGSERAAPMVRRRARELGIELSRVRGTGPEGRILLQDLEREDQARGRGEAPQVAAPAPLERGAPAPAGLSRQRVAIARTVSESWRTIPHFQVTLEIVMDEGDKLRQQLKESDVALSVNDLVVKGAALALEKFPQMNASLKGEGIAENPEVNICLAVSLPDGLLMPVLPGCQKLSLQEIGVQSRALVERARAGQLSERELGGGTFSISNLGMFGVSQFNAIIYPSQTAVLAVGTVAPTVVVKDGAPAVAKVMKVTLSADHRVVDGAYAANFLNELKEVLEHPLRLLL